MKFGIKNFRIFSEHQEFELTPITLLTGPNNSGKSALQKAIYLLKNSFINFSNKLELDALNFDGISKKIGSFVNNLTYSNDLSVLSFSFKLNNLSNGNPGKIFLDYSAKGLVSVKLFLLLNENYKQLFEINPRESIIFNYFDNDLLIDILHYVKKKGLEQDRILLLSKKVNNTEYILTKEERREIEDIKVNYGLEINSEKYETQDISIPFEWQVFNKHTNKDQLFNKNFEVSHKAFATSFKELVIGSILLDEINEINYFNNPNKEHGSYEKIKSMLINENIFSEDEFIEKYKKFEKIVFEMMIVQWNRTLSQVVKTPDGQHYFFDENLNRIIWHTIGRNVTQMKFHFDNYIGDNAFFRYIKENQHWGNILKGGDIDKIRDFDPTIEGAVNYSIKASVSILNELWEEAMQEIRLFVSRTNLFLFDNDNLEQRHLFFNDKNTFTLTLSKFAKDKEAGIISKNQIDFINKWLVEFHLGDSIEIEKILAGKEWIGVDYYLSKSGNKVPLNDNGLGANKLILIIIQIASSNSNSRFLFEEPEIGLHPKYQSLLADMFNDAYNKFGHNFIIETHSEYLIRKLQYLTAKKKIKPKESIVYYFYAPDNIPKGEKQVKEIRIREDGMMDDDFGEGFFDESTRLTIDLLNLQNKN